MNKKNIYFNSPLCQAFGSRMPLAILSFFIENPSSDHSIDEIATHIGVTGQYCFKAMVPLMIFRMILPSGKSGITTLYQLSDSESAKIAIELYQSLALIANEEAIGV